MPTTHLIKISRSLPVELPCREVYRCHRNLAQRLNSQDFGGIRRSPLSNQEPAQIPPDGANPGPTAIVSNKPPSPCDRLHHPKSPTIPCLVSTTGAYLQALVTQYPPQTAPLPNSHSLSCPYLCHSTSYPSCSRQESVTSPFNNIPTEGRDILGSCIPDAKAANPGHNFRRSQPIHLMYP